ncbi:MAG: hypothetical protein A3G18_06560 [Rhodospirillales bacterium RIFCSPLOWO2_12_FULL_58_28]|nr:MAG: hypothetical protein A3H92_08770 [Rhodospirillales bacterium RIFCSPLOWO2_02_FULL_58_16]OHC79182.1 MAG: hypothetical protein A3G18_06560 [Rhodospirillales bacterium RIFCSPLOWO2_12_FULL_58_28]
MKPLGIITGLALEARCLGAGLNGLTVRCSGPGPERAGKTARALLKEGCTALISFGLAGGLDPAIGPGDLVLADSVITADGKRFVTDREWRQRLCAALSDTPCVSAPLLGVGQAITMPEDKRRLFLDTGAVAVDMESHAVAEVADEAGIPFLAVRVIADPAAGEIPSSALKGVGEDGRSRPLAVALALLWRPWELPAILRLKRDSDRALAALRRIALLVGPSFGSDD